MNSSFDSFLLSSCSDTELVSASQIPSVYQNASPISELDKKLSLNSILSSQEQEKNKQMKTFQDLLQYNLEFLTGKRDKVCYHQDCVDSETEPYLSQLVSLHELNILTTCSQPGYSKDESGYSQKPYIEFYCHPSQMSIIKKLEKKEGYLFYVSDSQGNKIYASKAIHFPFVITKLYNKGTCYLPPMTNKKRRREYFWDNFESWTSDCLSDYYMVQMVLPKYTDAPIFDHLLLGANNFYQFQKIKQELKEKVKIISICGLMGTGKDYIVDNYLIPNIKEKYTKMSIAHSLKIRSVIEDFSDSRFLFGEKDFQTRKIFQDFGQQQKNLNGEDYWIDICIMDIYYQYKTNGIETFIISDCRFPNEALLLKDLGSKIIKIIAPERNEQKIQKETQTIKNYIVSDFSPYKRLKYDSSESFVDQIEADYIIHNNPGDVIDIEKLKIFLN